MAGLTVMPLAGLQDVVGSLSLKACWLMSYAMSPWRHTFTTILMSFPASNNSKLSSFLPSLEENEDDAARGFRLARSYFHLKVDLLSFGKGVSQKSEP
jgi:hypothetical protein